ncbi:hypothetical protein CC1G_15255 [Coprinopsis cinerea okayama7|uniref:Uncharacterized protein n=1 Tax=Coprinopsis cinerea (strain Okayama-7 / 130 / ATCC MYA-4618 / FGSC 9003) TaxID=240176 RepID=D6RPV4_COPC7|nr:hypothetical protein CC1G_15255 [Coprinopsis cinerea okayama7\|eukprot:XP_002910347.1 hypothetical protein CC1G_15255 [Coprinopsis cinerea okayama7\
MISIDIHMDVLAGRSSSGLSGREVGVGIFDFWIRLPSPRGLNSTCFFEFVERERCCRSGQLWTCGLDGTAEGRWKERRKEGRTRMPRGDEDDDDDGTNWTIQRGLASNLEWDGSGMWWCGVALLSTDTRQGQRQCGFGN